MALTCDGPLEAYFAEAVKGLQSLGSYTSRVGRATKPAPSQRSSYAALKHGAEIATCLEAVHALNGLAIRFSYAYVEITHRPTENWYHRIHVGVVRIDQGFEKGMNVSIGSKFLLEVLSQTGCSSEGERHLMMSYPTAQPASTGGQFQM